jgi:PAS domain-containing protein
MSADATSGTGRDHSPALYAPLGPEAQIAEHERQFREMLEFCPAALVIVDEDGRLLFHNARLRELLGYQKGRHRSNAADATSLVRLFPPWRSPLRSETR